MAGTKLTTKELNSSWAQTVTYQLSFTSFWHVYVYGKHLFLFECKSEMHFIISTIFPLAISFLPGNHMMYSAGFSPYKVTCKHLIVRFLIHLKKERIRS